MDRILEELTRLIHGWLGYYISATDKRMAAPMYTADIRGPKVRGNAGNEYERDMRT
jgi:hypothetical protein